MVERLQLIYAPIMTSAPKVRTNAAENQHYVPKFILRRFLANEAKEQVSVFDKQNGKSFPTSIANIMAERRFNDFQVNDNWRVSFEPAAGKVEDQVLATYQRVVANGRLERTVEEQSDLALLITFQFLRTKAHRDRWLQVDKMISDKTTKMGFKVEDIEGWVPPTEDNIKVRHLESMRKSLAEFSAIVFDKDMMLVRAVPGRSYYLGDNPVALHNDQEFGPYGNLGLSVPGIQLYLPLSADLVLCAFCPSIFGKARVAYDQGMQAARTKAFAAFSSGRISAEWMRRTIEAAEHAIAPQTEMLRHFEEGSAYPGTDDLMDFNNSLQVKYASRFIVCKNSDFALAKRFVKELPNAQGGRIRGD